jgi:membrane associated rhomboid family serine protease
VGNRGGMQMNSMVPITPVVKWLIGTCVVVWIVLQIIVEKYFLDQPSITYGLGLVPLSVIQKYFVWQVFTYQFLHSANVFHIVFNMLLLWWLGSELESRWGSKLFLAYYLVSGTGAGVIYVLAMAILGYTTGTLSGWTTPVIGASGAVFGLMLAYGVLFGERIVYFMMVFPMRAKWFVVILGAVEVATLLNSGVGGSQEANLAHLGGIASGFGFLKAYTWWQQRRWRNKSTKGRGRGLKLVVDNDRKSEGDGSNDDPSGGGGSGSRGGSGKGSGPKYWN